MKRLLFTLLLALSATQLNAKIEAYGGDEITPDVLPKVVHLHPEDSYIFDVTSKYKRKPVSIHNQNRDYLSFRCTRKGEKNDLYTFSCKVKVKEKSPEGTVAVFKKKKKEKNSVLFHVSIVKKEENNE